MYYFLSSLWLSFHHFAGFWWNWTWSSEWDTNQDQHLYFEFCISFLGEWGVGEHNWIWSGAPTGTSICILTVGIIFFFGGRHNWSRSGGPTRTSRGVDCCSVDTPEQSNRDSEDYLIIFSLAFLLLSFLSVFFLSVCDVAEKDLHTKEYSTI